MKLSIVPSHVAIILDGNGRWASKRGLPRSQGHYQGGQNLFTITKEIRKLGVQKLTVFAFSTENWKRPKEEVDYLLTKPIEIFETRKEELDHQVKFIGRRDRLPQGMLDLITDIEKRSEQFDDTFVLYVAIDYGGLEELIHVAQNNEVKDIESLKQALMQPHDVDLLIRTGGEIRISNFLLAQSAYAEFYFTKTSWPAFSKKELFKALKVFEKRKRRFGGL
ncbi:MAG: polyprenyl diphosphate synthase [Firmicutes bacterium]|nr:polyprenyl diphosphate synthase [Bacillota bacterium]